MLAITVGDDTRPYLGDLTEHSAKHARLTLRAKRKKEEHYQGNAEVETSSDTRSPLAESRSAGEVTHSRCRLC